jgi:hypothetical protein
MIGIVLRVRCAERRGCERADTGQHRGAAAETQSSWDKSAHVSSTMLGRRRRVDRAFGARTLRSAPEKCNRIGLQ